MQNKLTGDRKKSDIDYLNSSRLIRRTHIQVTLSGSWSKILASINNRLKSCIVHSPWFEKFIYPAWRHSFQTIQKWDSTPSIIFSKLNDSNRQLNWLSVYLIDQTRPTNWWTPIPHLYGHMQSWSRTHWDSWNWTICHHVPLITLIFVLSGLPLYWYQKSGQNKPNHFRASYSSISTHSISLSPYFESKSTKWPPASSG